MAGAAGFSTSFSFAHRGIDGKPVPSRFAERDEVEALFAAAGKAGKGVVLATPGEQCSYADFYEWRRASDGRSPGRCSRRPGNAAPHAAQDPRGRRPPRGANVWPQVTPRPLTMQFTLADAYSLNVGEVFGELLKVSRAVRMAAYRDPAWRARAAADLEQRADEAALGDLRGLRVASGSPSCRAGVSTDLARERGVQPARRDVRDRGRGGSRDALPRLHRQRRRRRRRRPAHARPRDRSVSPTPARTSTSCATRRCYTDLLGKWVRDRSLMPLEQAVRKLTGEAADMFGFVRRGYLREGYWADVCVFDPATVGPGPLRRVRDFPADAERLTAEPAHRRAARARERHADPQRRRRSSTRSSSGPACGPRSPEAAERAAVRSSGDGRADRGSSTSPIDPGDAADRLLGLEAPVDDEPLVGRRRSTARRASRRRARGRPSRPRLGRAAPPRASSASRWRAVRVRRGSGRRGVRGASGNDGHVLEDPRRRRSATSSSREALEVDARPPPRAAPCTASRSSRSLAKWR